MTIKIEEMKKIIAERKSAADRKAKLAADWEGKALSEFVTAQEGEVITMTLPVLAVTTTNGKAVWVTVPSFDGLHNRVKLSAVSYNGLLSQVKQYTSTEDHKMGLISVYTDGGVTATGDRTLAYNGLKDVSDLNTLPVIKMDGNTQRNSRPPQD